MKQALSDSYKDRFEALNDAQKKAVTTTEGPVLVIAGPGSGKTELLAVRIAYILEQNLAGASQILCLTFTDNAAINMRERLESLIGNLAYRVGIFTFHSFCNHIIGRYPEYFYNAAHFTLANDVARAEVLESIFKELPHKHVFASFHPTEGFVYLRDVRDRIKHIKSGGYTSDEFAHIVAALSKEYEVLNTIVAAWPEGRLSIKTLDAFAPIADALAKSKTTTGVLLGSTLRDALNESESIGKTEPLSKWKKKYVVVDDDGVCIKDAYNLPKLEALVEIYKAYETTMHEKGLYDYDDMIIDVAHALKESTALRSEIEEQYQYILIDEFQDTNEAQMNLVRAITSSEHHEGRPNVLVVGDDDQAIYKFQGAEVSHVMNFRDKTYRDVETIVLDNNYRSTEEVLSLARTVITQGKVRLENKYDDISKEMKAMNKTLPKGSIAIQTFSSDIEEYSFVARSIAKLVQKEGEGGEIAVLARGHKELRALLPYLEKEGVPYEYIKKANVFEQEHIRELIVIAEYIASVLAHGHTHDHLLPEILSFPFWFPSREASSNDSRGMLFDIAYRAKHEHISWITALKESKDTVAQHIYETLSQTLTDAESVPLERLLERFMEQSGFKEYYFGKEALSSTKSEYIYFLSSLKTFFEALREYKEGELLTVKDVAPFVSLHKEHDIPLISESLFTKSTSSVKLLSAHAAKGLEFSHVFIIAAHDDLWTKSPRTNKAPLPSVLTPLLTPAGDNEDDFIRLLYVAITRAKHSLSITAHSDMVRYLGTVESEEVNREEITVADHIVGSGLLSLPYSGDEQATLLKLVEHYKMPVTHVSNFINVLEGGPLYFIEQNLLRFPQPMIPSAVYGSAMHKAIEEFIVYPRFHGSEVAPLPHIIASFKRELSKGRLPQKEYIKQADRGEKVLTAYYKAKRDAFLPTDQIEVDMKDEGVMVGEAHLTGKLDFLRKDIDGYRVVDFKTGDTFHSWDEAGLTEYEKIKLHKYKTQLIVYKLLLENSSHYKQEVKELSLEFVESVVEKKQGLVTLSYEPTDAEVEDVKKLVNAVYKKIVELDFPDVSKYEKSYKGMLEFEKDLIEGRV